MTVLADRNNRNEMTWPQKPSTAARDLSTTDSRSWLRPDTRVGCGPHRASLTSPTTSPLHPIAKKRRNASAVQTRCARSRFPVHVDVSARFYEATQLSA